MPEFDYTDPQTKRRIRVITPQAQIGPNDYDVLNQSARQAKNGDTVYYNFPDAPNTASRIPTFGRTLDQTVQTTPRPQTLRTPKPSAPLFGSLDLSAPSPLALPPLTPTLAPRPVPQIGPGTIRPTKETRTTKDVPGLTTAQILGMRPAINPVVMPSASRFAKPDASYGLLDNLGYDAADQTRLKYLQQTGTKPAQMRRDLQTFEDADAKNRAETNALLRAARGEAGPAAAGLAVATLIGEAIPTPGGKGLGLLAKTAGKAALVGGGAMAGSALFGNVQDKALHELLGPEGYAAYQERNRQAAEQFPEATYIGQQLPFAATMKPGKFNLQSVLPRLTGGATNAGIDAGTQLVQAEIARRNGQTPLPYNRAQTIGAGAVGSLFTGLNPLGEALETGPRIAGRSMTPHLDRASRAISYAATAPPTNRGFFSDPLLLQTGADFAGRVKEGYKRTAPPLQANGQPQPLVAANRFDRVNAGVTPENTLAARQPLRTRVKPPAHDANETGIRGPVLDDNAKNGVIYASGEGPTSALYARTQEYQNPNIAFSIGGATMSASNSESMLRAVTEIGQSRDRYKNVTPQEVRDHLSLAGALHQKRLERAVARGDIKGFTPPPKRFRNEAEFLRWTDSVGFSTAGGGRPAILRSIAPAQRPGAAVRFPDWRDIVRAGDDPAYKGAKAGSAVAFAKLADDARPLTFREAGLQKQTKSYDTYLKGDGFGELADPSHWLDLVVVGNDQRANAARTAQAKRDHQTFYRLNPQVTLPVSAYAKAYGVKTSEFETKGVYNGIGDGTKSGTGGANAGTLPDATAGLGDGLTPRVDGGRADSGNAAGLGGGGLRHSRLVERADGSAVSAGGRPAVPHSPKSDGEGRSITRLGGVVKQPRRLVGTTDLSGDVPTGAAFNREPNPAGGRAGTGSGLAGGRKLPEGSRQTTGAVSARGAFTPRADLDAKIARADELFSRDTNKPGSIDPATGEPNRKVGLRLRREVEQASPGYYQARNDAANETAVTQARAKRQTEPPTDLFGGEVKAQQRQKPPYEEKVDLSQVDVLPGLQYKTGTNRDAVTDQFAGETDFKMERAGRGTVYKDAQGKLYAVDLHHRTDLFKRSKTQTVALADGTRVDAPDKRVTVQVLDAADGWTPETAKRYGITQNLAENKGEPLDAAEGLLGAGTLDEARRDVSGMQNGELKRNTAGLIELDSRGRELVANNKVDKAVAAGIGTVLKDDPERQKIALADAIKSRGIRNYDDGAKLATTVLYEPVTEKQNAGQEGFDFGNDFDSGYVSTAGKQTEIEQTIRQVLQRAGSDLLRPTTASLREGETIDTAGRQAEAAQIADTRSKADALFSYDPAVRKALRDNGTRAQKGEITDAEAAANVQAVVQERGKLSVADIVAGAGTQGERARPAPLPVRQRTEAPANVQPAVQPARTTAPKLETAQERLARLAAQDTEGAARRRLRDFSHTEEPPNAKPGPNGQQTANLFPIGKPTLIGRARENFPTLRRNAADALNAPRSLGSSLDLSAPLRQGAVLTLAEPGAARGAWAQMFKTAFSEKNFDKMKEAIAAHPDYRSGKDAGLYLSTQAGEGLGEREEAFMSKLVANIPHVKASDRAYVAYLDQLRMNVWQRNVRELRAQGLDPVKDEKTFREVADFINVSTGRGNLPKFLKGDNAAIVNGALFSPRFAASRVELLTKLPYKAAFSEKYGGYTPAARKIAARNMARFTGAVLATAIMAKAGGADISTDPDDADFLKIKLPDGETRYDISAGTSQYIRLAARAAAGMARNFTGEGNKRGSNPKEVVEQFMRGKLSPAASYGMDAATGKTFDGKPFHPGYGITDRVVPMITSDLFTALRDEGVPGLAQQMTPEKFVKRVPDVFGVSTSVYQSKGGNKIGGKLLFEKNLDRLDKAGGELPFEKRMKARGL